MKKKTYTHHTLMGSIHRKNTQTHTHTSCVLPQHGCAVYYLWSQFFIWDANCSFWQIDLHFISLFFAYTLAWSLFFRCCCCYCFGIFCARITDLLNDWLSMYEWGKCMCVCVHSWYRSLWISIFFSRWIRFYFTVIKLTALSLSVRSLFYTAFCCCSLILMYVTN